MNNSQAEWVDNTQNNSGLKKKFWSNLFRKREKAIWTIQAESNPGIDDKIAEFIISQAEKSLAYTLDIADKATNRAYAVILIIIPLTSTFIGLFISELHGKFPNVYRVNLYLAATIVCTIVLVLLLTIILPRATMGMGRAPRDIAQPHMLQNDLPAKEKFKAFKLNEIKNLQFKIDYNNRLNSRRIFRFKVALLICCLGFIGGAICYAMLVSL